MYIAFTTLDRIHAELYRCHAALELRGDFMAALEEEYGSEGRHCSEYHNARVTGQIILEEIDFLKSLEDLCIPTVGPPTDRMIGDDEITSLAQQWGIGVDIVGRLGMEVSEPVDITA